MTTRTVAVPPERLARWCDNFTTRHGPTTIEVVDGRLRLTADDGESASAVLPFGRSYAGPPDPALVADAAAAPLCWGVLLVRKGGFAVARLGGPGAAADHVVDSKVGQRHVQGRTKAGGQSQQRFARRRDNQARQAYEAAADHAARILGDRPPDARHADEPGGGVASRADALVVGGDRQAVDAVLDDRRLTWLRDLVVDPWLPVPDPRRAVLDEAISTARSLRITLSA
jgi:hypothetical protein